MSVKLDMGLRKSKGGGAGKYDIILFSAGGWGGLVPKVDS